MTIIDSLKGSSLISISLVCDLVKLDFMNGTELICLHIQSALMRGLKGDELLISSNDIYLPSRHYKKKLFKKFKWDIPGNSLFDDQLFNFKNEVLNKKIYAVQTLGKDLILEFEGDCKIEILSCTMEKGREFFRIFRKGDLDSHIVIES